MRHLILFLIFLTSPLFAQEGQETTAQSASPSADKDKCTVEGKVVDASTGKPLRKAILTLVPTERRDRKPISVSTEADGVFFFKAILSGRFRLIAARRGYVDQQYGETGPRRPGTIIALQSGHHLKDILFRLQAGAAISGRVFDEDGEPMSDVEVNALRETYGDGGSMLVPVGSAGTNDLGEYRIFGLPPGEYFIRAGFNETRMSGSVVSFANDQPGESTYAPAFYPGVQEPSQASVINLRRGDNARADFNLTPSHAVSVRGKVINISGIGGRAWLALMPRREKYEFMFGQENTASVTSDGIFEFHHVLPGSYVITGRTNDEKARYMARQNVDVADHDVSNVVVVFRQGKDIPGHLTLTGSFPGRVSDLNVFLHPDSSGMVFGARTSTKDDGSFLIAGVADDVYRLMVSQLPPNAYIKSVLYGSEDVLEKGFDPAGANESLEIVISGDGGRISGAVSDKDQKAQPGITVVAIPDHPIRWISERSKPTSTDQNSRFLIQGLRPGRYRLYAFEEIEPGASDDPQFMKRYLDRGRALDISENSQQTVDLTVITREENQ